MTASAERDAVAIIVKDLREHHAQGHDPENYCEELAIEALVRHGIRPSRLSADLGWLIERACVQLVTGGRS